jgi:hypothetical protein
MAALGIHNSGNALVIRAEREPSLTNGLVAAFASGFFWVIVFHSLLRLQSWWLLGSTTIPIAGISFLLAVRRKSAELRISRDEIILRGRVGDSFRSRRRVNPQEVKWLEYQADTTGPETSHHPEGLYAVLSRHSVCLLPDIDAQQTATVIEQIHSRFPDLSRKWQSQSPFGQNFLSLGLKS